MVFAAGVALGAATPELPTTAEMLSRTSPRMLDLVVALASGAVAAYAASSARLSAALVGVSIAVALVPPLTTSGLFATRGAWDHARGAALLAFVNMVAIQVGASAALWFVGGRDASRPPESLRDLLRRQAVSLALMTALVATLAWHGLAMLHQQRYESAVRAALQQALAARPLARLDALNFGSAQGRATVLAVVGSPARFTPQDVRALSALLPTAPDGSRPRLQLRWIDVQVESD